MKYTIEQIKQGDDELILRYQDLNQEVEHVMNFMSFSEKKLVGTKEGSQVVIDVGLATLFWTNILRTINYFYYSSYPANSSVLNSLYSTGVK